MLEGIVVGIRVGAVEGDNDGNKEGIDEGANEVLPKGTIPRPPVSVRITDNETTAATATRATPVATIVTIELVCVAAVVATAAFDEAGVAEFPAAFAAVPSALKKQQKQTS